MYKTLALLAGLIALSNGASTRSLKVNSFLQQGTGSNYEPLPADKFELDANRQEQPNLGDDNHPDKKTDYGTHFESDHKGPAPHPKPDFGDFNLTEIDFDDLSITESGLVLNGTEIEFEDFNLTESGLVLNGTEIDFEDFNLTESGLVLNGTEIDFEDFNLTESGLVLNGTEIDFEDFNLTESGLVLNGTEIDFDDFNLTESGLVLNGTEIEFEDLNITEFVNLSQHDFGDLNGTDFGDLNGTEFGDFDDLYYGDFDDLDFGDLNDTEFEDFNATEFEDFNDWEWIDPKAPSENYTYEELLDEIIDSSEDVIDTSNDLKDLQGDIVSTIDQIRFALISIALDDQEAAEEVLSDIEECVEDEEVYDETDDYKIWDVVNSCWTIRPEDFAANLLTYNTYWVLYAVDACQSVDVEYKQTIQNFYENPEEEFQSAAENEAEEGTDPSVLLSLKDFTTSKISKINLLQQASEDQRDEEDIQDELESLYSEVVEELYRTCYEAYELRNELNENLFETYYPSVHLPYPYEEPTDEVLEAYEEVLSE